MPSDSSHLNNEEIKLEILRIVVEAGTLNQKENPSLFRRKIFI